MMHEWKEQRDKYKAGYQNGMKLKGRRRIKAQCEMWQPKIEIDMLELFQAEEPAEFHIWKTLQVFFIWKIISRYNRKYHFKM